MKDSHADALQPGRMIALPVISDPRGCLSFLQAEGGAVPFGIGRVYWVYDIRGERSHAGRALRHGDELMVVLSGSCDVRLDDGAGHRATYRLTRPSTGLLIPAGTWREIDELATNTVYVVLASDAYDPGEIVRDYQEFIKLKNP